MIEPTPPSEPAPEKAPIDVLRDFVAGVISNSISAAICGFQGLALIKAVPARLVFVCPTEEAAEVVVQAFLRGAEIKDGAGVYEALHRSIVRAGRVGSRCIFTIDPA